MKKFNEPGLGERVSFYSSDADVTGWTAFYINDGCDQSDLLPSLSLHLIVTNRRSMVKLMYLWCTWSSLQPRSQSSWWGSAASPSAASSSEPGCGHGGTLGSRKCCQLKTSTCKLLTNKKKRFIIDLVDLLNTVITHPYIFASHIHMSMGTLHYCVCT